MEIKKANEVHKLVSELKNIEKIRVKFQSKSLDKIILMIDSGIDELKDEFTVDDKKSIQMIKDFIWSGCINRKLEIENQIKEIDS